MARGFPPWPIWLSQGHTSSGVNAMRVYDNGREVDATFSIQGEGVSRTLVFESRGGGRNSEYAPGLELLLERLASFAATVTDVHVSSREVEGFSQEQTRLSAVGYALPLSLASVGNPGGLRIAWGRAMGQVGRSPDAGRGGNGTKRISISLDSGSWADISSEDLETTLATRGAIRYWALGARPNRYRALEACKSLDSGFWKVEDSDVRPGDMAVIWQYTDSEGRRGIVGLAEVEGHPFDTDSIGDPFWVNEEFGREVARRVPIRFIHASGLPLWITKDDALASALSVARARGGTVFKITLGQWNQIWSRVGAIHQVAEEVEALELLAARPSQGQRYVKDARRRQATEKRAMQLATEYFEREEYSVKDVSANSSFDLLCTKGDTCLRVEVKGTSNHGEEVIVTEREMLLAETGDYALFVVAGIAILELEGGPVGQGGTSTLYHPFQLDRANLRPLAHTLVLSSIRGKRVD